MASTRWRDLSPGSRRIVVGVAAVDVTLRVAALVDLARRPPAQLRGAKWTWAVALAVINSAGILPASYFAVGRRR